jgi:hypothetical protein
MSIVIELLALIIGVGVGLQLPDVDRVFSFFLVHRSILTHSALLPYLAYLLVRRQDRRLYLAVAGIALGVAVHLAFDLFPRRWYGFAQINVPLIGYLNGTLSVLWIAGSIVACCYLALRLITARRELAIALFIAACGFVLSMRREATWLMPLASLGVAFFFATCLPNGLFDGATAAREWTRAARAAVRRP